MTTSATPFPSEMIKDGEIDSGKLAYFRERLKNRLHEVVLLEFLHQQDTYQLTKAELGRRIGKPPERITRLLAAPGNWELETVSDLLLGMGSELDFNPVLLVNKIRDSNAREPSSIGESRQSAASPNPQQSLYALAAPREGIVSTQSPVTSFVSGMTGAANVQQQGGTK